MLTEVKTIKQITVLPASNAVNVQWANQILRDGEVISETFERKAYTADQKDSFIAEVEGAAAYVTALGWTT